LFEANAGVAGAEANQGKTALDVKRYTPLAKAGAITEQELDNAVQAISPRRPRSQLPGPELKRRKPPSKLPKLLRQLPSSTSVSRESFRGRWRCRTWRPRRSAISSVPTGDRLTTVSTVMPIKPTSRSASRSYLDYVRTNPRRATEGAGQAIELADLRGRQSCNAIDRRNDSRETEVDSQLPEQLRQLDGGFRRFNSGPGSCDRGLRGEIGLDGIVEFLFRDGAAFASGV